MANLISAVTGNFTTAGTWQTVDATSELDSEAGNTAISTSNLDSATFVPTAITVDGVALKLNARAASPSGTFKVTLRDSTTSTDIDSCTVNVSDLPANPKGVWLFFKFGSSHVLSGTDSYLIRVVCSTTGSQVTLYRNGTANNWSRKLRTTTTQAPAANNHLVISGQFISAGNVTAVTVTMNNTAATTWGPSSVNTQGITVGSSGTLTCGVVASTAYVFQWRGMFLIAGGGTVNFGTSGSRIPSTSSVTLAMDCAANADSSLKVDTDGTLNIYGATKTPWTRLTADAASSATSITVSAATGWQDADKLGFSPTGSSTTAFETKNIASSGVSGLTITLSAGLTNAHTGTGLPTNLQAYVINLTRNIKFKSLSTSNKGNLFIPAAGGTVTIDSMECVADTIGTNSTNNRPFDIQSTTNVVSVTSVTFNPGGSTASGIAMVFISGAASNNFTIDNVIGYNCINSLVNLSVITTGTTWTISNCIGMGQTEGSNYFDIQSTGGTFTGNVAIAGTSGSGIRFGNSDASSFTQLSTTMFANNEAQYFSGGNGFILGITSSGSNEGYVLYLTNCRAYRNGTSTANPGFALVGSWRKVIFDTCDVMGNTNGSGKAGIQFVGLSGGSGTTGNIVLYNCTLSGDTTFNQCTGISNDTNTGYGLPLLITCYNTTFGATSGIRKVHNTFDVNIAFPKETIVQIYANKSSFASTTPLNNLTSSFQQILGDHVDFAGSFLRCQDFNQTANDHRTFVPQGNIQTDTSVFHTASPSQKMTPNSAANKLRSGIQTCTVASGVSRTVAVWVRQSKSSSGDSADYNGAQPRLVVRRNDCVGISVDTVVATGTVAIGNWEQLTGVAIASPTEDGAIDVFVDCDGTTGFINVDDYSIS